MVTSLWLGLSIGAASANVLYVATDGTDVVAGGGTNGCANRSLPCATLARALQSVSTDGEIRIAAGHYAQRGIRIDRPFFGVTIRGGYVNGFAYQSDDRHTTFDGGLSDRLLVIRADGIDSTIALENLDLSRGTAVRGGAIHVSAASGGAVELSLHQVALYENRAERDGGAIYAETACCDASRLDLRVTLSRFDGNEAFGETGQPFGGFGFGGAVSIHVGPHGLVDAEFDRTDFRANSASQQGSALYLETDGEAAQIVGRFEKSHVFGNVGGFASLIVRTNRGSANLEFENNLIALNVAGEYSAGGGVRYRAEFDGRGGTSIDATHTNDTIWSNSASGIHADRNDWQQTFLSVDLLNTIVWGNSGRDVQFFSGTSRAGGGLVIDHSDVGNLHTLGYVSVTETARLSVDPLVEPFTERGLDPASPAIDAGVCSAETPDSDIRGVHRPQGRSCDIGAFEYVPEPTGFATSVTALLTIAGCARGGATRPGPSAKRFAATDSRRGESREF